MKLWLPALLAIPLAAAAEVYRSVDEQGNVTYSDTPGPGTEAVEVPGVSTYAPPAYRPAGTPPADGTPAGAPATDYRLEVISPPPGGVVRSGSGRLEVELAVSPPPRDAGHTLMYRLDDQQAAATGTPRFALHNLPRGPHTLTVWVADAEGRQLGTGQVVQFRVLRGSGLFHPVPGNGAEGSGVQQAPRAPMAPRAPRPDPPQQYAPTPAPP